MFNNLLYFKFTLRKITNYNKLILFSKLFNLKKQKWLNLLIKLKTQLKPSKFYKYKLLDHNKILIFFFSNKFNTYKNIYKETFIYFKNLKLFYFNKKINKFFKQILKTKLFIENFETCIDFVLFRAKFCSSVFAARFFVLNGFIYINNNKIATKSYNLKSGDCLTYKIKSNKFNIFLINSLKYPIPYKNLIINYKTKQILFLKNFKTTHLKNYFAFYLKSLEFFLCIITKQK